jgi:subtilase family serine protease
LPDVSPIVLRLLSYRIHLHLSTALAITAASVLVGGASTASATTSTHAGRAMIPNTTPVSGSATPKALASTTKVQLSVFVGQNQAGMSAAATAVSNPTNPNYGHYLSPAQIQARFGATAAQQSAVRAWLTDSGLTVTSGDGFVISAEGTATKAEAALQTDLALSKPASGDAQVVPSEAMSVPTDVASAISTIRVSTASTVLTPHQQLQQELANSTSPTATSPTSHDATAAATSPTTDCSAYYGQNLATDLPQAYGRTISWAPCGYTAAQVRDAYGATRSGLTGAGTTVAVLSEADYPTALSDVDEWSQQQNIPQFAAGQFTMYVAPNSGGGALEENALDIEAVHGMAPAAKVNYVVGSGAITGDALLDGLDTIVQQHLANVVTSSWYEGYMSQTPTSMITAWEGVLERAALEGITVDLASGDVSNILGLQYPSSDPWATAVGGTSLAIGARDNTLWETAWNSDGTNLSADGLSWDPAPPGDPDGGSTGGVSETFAEPSYQDGVVSGNSWDGEQMRAVPDVSALADPELGGYQIGVTMPTDPQGDYAYQDEVQGGTSLSTPLFAGFEADLIQGRGGIPLGFANPLLYAFAHTAAFHDVTSDPQGSGSTEAVAYQPPTYYAGVPPLPLTLTSVGQCGVNNTLTCGPGYDMVTGIGSPGPAFFRSFGSLPR